MHTVPQICNYLLAAVAAVARTSPQLLGMSHVLLLFMDYLLDTGLSMIEHANKAGLYCITKRLLSKCDLSTMPQACRDLCFTRGITEAASHGSIKLVELWFTHFPMILEGIFTAAIYQRAVAKSHVNLLEWLYSRGALADNEHTSNMITSITYCRPVVVYWLHSHFANLRLSISVENVACLPSGEGALAFLEWLWNRKRKFAISKLAQAQTKAAYYGNLPVLIWLYEYRVGEYCIRTLESAAKRGHFEVVEWLFDRRHDKINVATFSNAILEKGQFQIFNWLFDRLDSFGTMQISKRRNKWAIEGAREAALQGQLHTLKKLYVITKRRISGLDLLTITRRGHLNVLKWLLKQQGYSHFDNRMTDCAAEKGHLEIVKFLCGKGKPGTKCAMDEAAVNGHFEVLKHLHQHSEIGFTTRAMDRVASSNRLDIVQWLHANCYEGCTTRAMNFAAKNGWVEMVQWLHENRREGCTVAAMNDAAGNGHLQMLKWLHANRSESCTEVAMICAARNGHLEVVQWLHATLSMEFSHKTLIGAAVDGHLKVIQWHVTYLPGYDYGEVLEAAIKNGRLCVAQWIYANICAEWEPTSYNISSQSDDMNWLYMELLYSNNFSLSNHKVDLDRMSDAMLEWIMRHFPNRKNVTREVQKRRDFILKPIKYDIS